MKTHHRASDRSWLLGVPRRWRRAAAAAPRAEPPTELRASRRGGHRRRCSKDAQAKFNAALDAFVAHDKANDWNDATCSRRREAVRRRGRRRRATKHVPEATLQRRPRVPALQATTRTRRRSFEQALDDDPKFHHARAQLALYQYKADANDRRGDRRSSSRPFVDAQFQNVPALVNLAMLQMQRDSATARTDGCKDDMECAKKNLQRALAIDDALHAGVQPARALLLRAREEARRRDEGAREEPRAVRSRRNAAMQKRADVQQLELAALVCSQAIRKNPNYAPIHNTAGLIQNELGQVNGAVGEFATAREARSEVLRGADELRRGQPRRSAASSRREDGVPRRRSRCARTTTTRTSVWRSRSAARSTTSNYDKQRRRGRRRELDACKKIDAGRARTPTTTRASSRRSTRRRPAATRPRPSALDEARRRSSRRSSRRPAASPSTTAP